MGCSPHIVINTGKIQLEVADRKGVCRIYAINHAVVCQQNFHPVCLSGNAVQTIKSKEIFPILCLLPDCCIGRTCVNYC